MLRGDTRVAVLRQIDIKGYEFSKGMNWADEIGPSRWLKEVAVAGVLW